MFKVNTKENYTLKTHVEALKTLYIYVIHRVDQHFAELEAN